MALIQWTNALSVDVAEVDKQHQKLIQMINDLNEAMQSGKGKEAVGKIIGGLIDYTQTHFKYEENIFDKYSYPDTPAHKAKHVEFVNKISEFNNGLKQGQLSLSIKIMDYLSDWLKNHIMKIDKQYTPFFHSKGLK
jgi:hemerythrin